MDNTSGHGVSATVPAEIDRWNWGAFLLNWIWGIGNSTFIALLMFVPFVNIVMPFVLGVKGSAWAWRNKKWESVEHFKTVQRKWTKWALLIYALMLAALIGLIFVIAASFKHSEVYETAMEKLKAHAEVMQILGTPIDSGMPMGSIEVSGPSGHANFSLSVKGPKGKGTIYVQATKDMGKWQIDRLIFEEEGSGRRIDLNGGARL